MFEMHNFRVPQWLSDATSNVIVEANEAALQVWRYPREQFVGLPATALLCEEEVPKSERIRHTNLWGETGPWRCRRGDGSECYMRVRWQQIDYKGRLCNYVFAVELGETLDLMSAIAPPRCVG
jgi:PAS domain-containing protein